MRFINVDKLLDKRFVSKTLLDNILKEYKLPQTTIDFELMCKRNIDKLYLEDTTNYDDIYNSLESNRRTHAYVVKDVADNKIELLCFKPQEDKVQIRSLKQKLSDITTGYFTNQFNDESFAKFFYYFYVPLNKFIVSYAKYNKLRIPEDIAFYYKGGNLFRLLLTDISRLMENREYLDLLKRSDADFQIFVNPSLPNYDKVFNDITVFVLYNLTLFKKTIHKYKIFDFFYVDEKKLKELYKKELETNGIHVSSIEFLKNNSRKDFTLEKTKYNNENVILYKEHKSILNTPKIDVSKDFFVSHNAALSFIRKDNIKAEFNLSRMKYNVKIKIITTDGNTKIISVPSEIIDVSMPRRLDHGSKEFSRHASRYVKLYTFSTAMRTFSFYAPTINYLIKDLDDVLFKQSKFIWQDLKIDKRIIRYFMSLLFHNIMFGIMEKRDLVDQLNLFKKELQSTINLVNCHIERTACEYNNNQLSLIFDVKYRKISKVLNSITNITEKKKELENFKEFNIKLVNILKKFVKEVNHILANSGKFTKEKIDFIFNKLITDKTTSILG